MSAMNITSLIDLSNIYSKEYGIDFDCYERIDHFLDWFENKLRITCLKESTKILTEIEKRPSKIREKVLGNIDAELECMEYKNLNDISDEKHIEEIISVLYSELYSFYEDEEDMWDRYFAKYGDDENDYETNSIMGHQVV